MHAPGRLQGIAIQSRCSPCFQPQSPPRSGTGVKGGSAIKEPPPPSVTAPGPNLSSTDQNSIPFHLLPLHNVTFTRVLCNSRVLTERSGIEAGIDWVNPRVPFQGLYSHPRVE